MADEDLKNAVQAEIERTLRWSTSYRKMWSFLHHLTAFTIISLSILAAYCAATLPDSGKFVAALSSLAALLTGIQTFAGMDRKWATYRITHTEFEKISRDFASGQDLHAISDHIHEVHKAHDQAVLGGIRVDDVRRPRIKKRT